jgi:hypothetical protein
VTRGIFGEIADYFGFRCVWAMKISEKKVVYTHYSGKNRWEQTEGIDKKTSIIVIENSFYYVL